MLQKHNRQQTEVQPPPSLHRMLLISFIIGAVSLQFGCPMIRECPHSRDAVPTNGEDARRRTPPTDDVDCSDLAFHFKYRSADGSCNNFESPDWGSAKTPMIRLMAAEYEDGSGTPIGFFDLKYSGYKKPNTRKVSLDIFKANYEQEDIRHNALLSHWGQFVAHDLTLASEMEINCTVEFFDRDGCFNIPIPRTDSRMPRFGIFPFKRSESCMDFGRRQQVNKLTAFVDASQVYGSSRRIAEKLRGSGGYLRMNAFHRSPRGKSYLPFGNEAEDVSCFRNISGAGVSSLIPLDTCFFAGDRRVNEQLMLTSLHTVLLREHNRIVSELKVINPLWSPETLYLETKKIDKSVFGAIMQRITYNDWLPSVLGPVGMHLIGDYRGYRRDVNPGIANSVATAALRFGHAFVVPVLKRLDESYATDPVGDVRLRDAFFDPETILRHGIDSLIRGAIGSPVKDIRPGGMVNEELTEHLFPSIHSFPLDLAAMNIQRGRDHGLPPYNTYRELCGLSRIATWQQYYQEARDARSVDSLAKLYGSPDNLDLWVGGLMERPLRGAKIGRTFTCLLADQFRRIRDGDRFWYENPDAMGGRQIQAIKDYSLSKLLCNNLDTATWMPANVFVYYPSLVAQFQRCKQLTDLDLTAWRSDNNGFAGTVECSTPSCICRYRIGEWRPCSPADQRQYRTDSLVTGIYPPCTNRRVVSRLCDGHPRFDGAINPLLFEDQPRSPIDDDHQNIVSGSLSRVLSNIDNPHKRIRDPTVPPSTGKRAVDIKPPKILPGPMPTVDGNKSTRKILPTGTVVNDSSTSSDVGDKFGLELAPPPAKRPPPTFVSEPARVLMVPGSIVEMTNQQSSDGTAEQSRRQAQKDTTPAGIKLSQQQQRAQSNRRTNKDDQNLSNLLQRRRQMVVNSRKTPS